MRILTVFLASIPLLIACSGAAPKSESINDEYSGKVEVDSVQRSGNPGSVPVASATTNTLAEAVKSGSDENIFRAATSLLMQNANDVKALNAMGLFHYRKGHPLAARLFFTKAIGLQGTSSELYSNLGLTYLSTKEEPQAFRYFRKAIEMNPSELSAITNLGSLYLERRDFSKAYAVLSLYTGRIKDLKFMNNLAVASAWKGKLDQAESLYRDALKMSPNSRELLFNYSIFLIEYQSRFKEGLETLDHLKLIGLVEGMKNTTKELEIRAKAGLK